MSWYCSQVFKCFQIFIGTTDTSVGWKSRKSSEESITTPTISENSFAPKLTYIHNPKIAVKFEGSYLK